MEVQEHGAANTCPVSSEGLLLFQFMAKKAEGKSVGLQEDTYKILDAGFWPKFIITHSQ